MDKSSFLLGLRRCVLFAAAGAAFGAMSAEPQALGATRAAAHGFIVRIDAAAATPVRNGMQAQRAATPATAHELARHLAASAPGGSVRHLHGEWYVVTNDAPAGSPSSDALGARLRALPGVRDVAPNAQEPRAAVPNDTLFGTQQWWLQGYDAGASAGVAGFPAAWDRSTGMPMTGMGPVVAVLDSGITSHPDLDARLVGPGYDFVSRAEYANDGNGRDNDPSDPGDALSKAERDADLALWDGCAVSETSSWHGTLAAGQVGSVSNNAAGVAGINWGARVLPVRVGGKCGAAVADLVDGMRWAAGLSVAGVPANANPARIVVVGFAGFEPCDVAHPTPAIAAAARLYIDTLAELRNTGVFVVAAAGNARGAVGRPASCAGAFAVTSLNRLGFKAVYANWGPQIALATVGGDGARGASCDTQLADSGLVSTFNAGVAAPGGFAYGAGSGTSFAAPGVAGVASLMLAVNPALSVTDLERGLRVSARPHVAVPALGLCDATKNPGRCQCSTSTCGAGILDAEQALTFAADVAGYVAPQRGAASLDSEPIRQCAIALGLTPPMPVEPEPAASAPVDGGGGGGAATMEWALALFMAVALLVVASRRDDGL